MALIEPERSAAQRIRVDLQLIADMVLPGSRVLDIGCGDGALLDYLVHVKQVDGRGMELSQAGVNACVTHGLPVIQGDADTDLSNYPDDAFDYVILSQTLQATRDPRQVMEQLVRVGRAVIVSFPNFGHWRARWHLMWRGRMPETRGMPLKWYNTPNIHFCTIRDFVELCQEMSLTIERAMALDDRGQASRVAGLWLANLFGEQGMFLLRRR